MSAIETEDLRKRYGDLQALKGVSLEVDEGEFFGLLGPNGAGKTTFINILVGLVKKSGGEARVFGYDVEDDYREARDAIGLAPQEFNVDRFFPIREVLVHKAGYHGVPKDVAEERADEALRTVGIYDKRDTRFHWLSGGMKRRFMLARAMVTDPDLLILDEPTAGVDVQLRHDLWEIITRMNEEGTTVLLTTHYIEEAERLCDRVGILDEGEVVEVSSPDELMSRGTDTVRVTLAGEIDAVPSALNGKVNGGADADGYEARVEDGELVVETRNAGATLAEVMRALDDAGHDVVDVEMSRTSLEEIFVEVTRDHGDVTRAPEGDA
ncbi:ABC transporter ATP-binding protein [Haladaptatus sp. F3-133]|uniref:ABC transporter ATP-binding protein n=1 Tax=Halorutilus salinus TaxID=2487751 RepID=A0A9Q4C3T5_9EURY|nr:ABC transporter ATP-binding protein [Halorutilus salinus]